MARPPYPRLPWLIRRNVFLRSQQILATLIRHGMDWIFTRFAPGVDESQLARRVFSRARRTPAEEFVDALVELGPTFIKFGQALSSRLDLLPPEYIAELSKLQDLVPPTPYEQILTVLKSELKRDPQDIFIHLDPQPLASASIGQVYGATLWSGEEVVIKIVRPGAREVFEQDIQILTDLANWASNHTVIGRYYDLRMLVDEFAFTVRAEFDYLREGQNIEAFRTNFADDPVVHIPKVYWDYTTHQVITMERFSGIKLNDLQSLDAAGIDRRTVAENLMHFALRQIFEFGLYHADPHAGNFFVQPDGSLAVMDFGMIGRLTPSMKRTFLGIAEAISRRDTEILVDELISANIFYRDLDRRAFTREMERLFDRFTGLSLKDLTGAQVMGEIMELVMRNHLQLPGELVAMTRAIIISEGTGMMLYPGFQLFTFAAPYVKRFWQEERSMRNMLPRISAAAMDGMELTMELPRRVTRLLSRLERGQLEVNINTEELNDLVSKFQKMTNRLTLGMILSAVIVALSLVLVVYKPETWQPIGEFIFGFALISSIIFGIWLIWSIIRTGRT
ncbi:MULTISPECIES: AarF/ABC1/UbiB kinase family protein [Anaerolinea]|uniref:ABC1 kinase family protein n=1 Tax=Anaerolinea TaxID=233189 RepID=UPI0026172DA6|nr:AarF/ABC1/UbiB kinase family protein [Anaerolinea thermophila]